MGTWICYKIAVIDTPETLGKLKTVISEFAGKEEGQFNALRAALNLTKGGLADYVSEPETKNDVLSFWIGIRNRYLDDLTDFCKAFKAKYAPEGEIYFLIDETDIDPGYAAEIGLITNDKDLRAFGEYSHRIKQFIKDEI